MDVLSEASSMEISESVAESLEGFLRKFGYVIKANLDSGDPAYVDPLKVRITPEAIPIRDKKCRYPAPKREFMAR